MLRWSDKRVRVVVLTVGGLVLAGLLWWNWVYTPLRECSAELDLKIEHHAMQLHKLKKKLKKLRRQINAYKEQNIDIRHITRFAKERATLEEANALTQVKIQEFLTEQEIPLKAYKELPAGKWREYPVGRLEFQLYTSTGGLAKLLEFLETIDELVKVEKLRVRYNRRRVNALRVTLRLDTLFITEAMKNKLKKK